MACWFEYLSGLPAPLRFAGYHHILSVSLPDFLPMPAGALLMAPIRQGGEILRKIYLAREELGWEYTREDKETLVMFSRQAALIIANARRYREEQRTRSVLETLINTSPVGVAVLDVRTGEPVSFNREATGIVDSLRGCVAIAKRCAGCSWDENGMVVTLET